MNEQIKKHLFAPWLAQQGLLIEYCTEYCEANNKQRDGVWPPQYDNNVRASNLMIEAFHWKSSSKGHLFWERIGNDWRRFLL